MLFVRYRLGWGGNFDDNAWMPVSQDRFPDGTLHMTAPKNSLFKDSDVDIHWKYDNDAELFSLICLRKHYADCKNVTLYMSYCPHARMDRVANTCNKSEDFIGYSTKFGDAAGDFSVLSEYTVSEVRQIGKALGIPDEFIFKAPEDGLSGKTDEDNLGFTYDELDNFLLQGHYPSYDVYKNIEERHKRNLHKVKPMPSCPRYYSTRDWEV